MNLVVNQYSNEGMILEGLKNPEERLMDFVYVAEIGFVNTINERTFFHSHLFCMYYCVDVYDSEKNLTFEILNADEKSNNYFYEKYTCNFYKPEAKSRKMDVDNAQIKVMKEPLSITIEENEEFNSVVNKVKGFILTRHQEAIQKFKNYGVNCDDKSVIEFTNQLKEYVDKCYGHIEQSELKDFIKKYEVDVLNEKLSQKETNTTKRVKI